MGIYAVFTIATALLVAVVLIPVLRLVFTPTPAGVEVPKRPGKQRTLQQARTASTGEAIDPGTLNAGSMAGGLGVLMAVAALVPMGGDGFLLNIIEPRLAVALSLALGLLLVGMTHTYQRLDGRQRLWLQLGFAVTASVAGLIPSGVRPDWVAHLLGALFLVACTNALQGLDSTDGLSSIVGAIAAAVMACVAHTTGSPAWGDLNLGLCGALLALLAYNLTHGRLRAELGTGGTLSVGFLLGASILRLGEQAAPPDRLWLMLPLALPLSNLTLVLLHRHVRNLPLDAGSPSSRDHLHHQLLRAGLSMQQVLVLYSAASCMAGLLALQFLGLL